MLGIIFSLTFVLLIPRPTLESKIDKLLWHRSPGASAIVTLLDFHSPGELAYAMLLGRTEMIYRVVEFDFVRNHTPYIFLPSSCAAFGIG